MCHIELSTCFNFIPFASGFPKHAAISFWSLACDTADQCGCVYVWHYVHAWAYVLAFCLCVFMHSLRTCTASSVINYYYYRNHPTTREGPAQFTFTQPHLSEWCIAPMFKVISVKWTWSLFSLTSHCTHCFGACPLTSTCHPENLILHLSTQPKPFWIHFPGEIWT